MRKPPVTGEPSPFIRKTISFLVNLVAGLISPEGSHPVVDTNPDGLRKPRRKNPHKR